MELAVRTSKDKTREALWNDLQRCLFAPPSYGPIRKSRIPKMRILKSTVFRTVSHESPQVKRQMVEITSWEIRQTSSVASQVAEYARNNLSIFPIPVAVLSTPVLPIRDLQRSTNA